MLLFQGIIVSRLICKTSLFRRGLPLQRSHKILSSLFLIVSRKNPAALKDYGLAMILSPLSFLPKRAILHNIFAAGLNTKLCNVAGILTCRCSQWLEKRSANRGCIPCVNFPIGPDGQYSIALAFICAMTGFNSLLGSCTDNDPWSQSRELKGVTGLHRFVHGSKPLLQGLSLWDHRVLLLWYITWIGKD